MELYGSLLNISGSVTASSFTGSFNGDGGGLYNLPASGVTGLNLSQIASGDATASISSSGFTVNTNTTITGSVTITGSLSLNGQAIGNESVVTHIVTASGGIYYIDGIANPALSFTPGVTYKFNTTAVTGAHPFKFSTSPNGPTEYTTGVTSGVNFLQIEVGYDTTTTLYYYCTAHNNMGNEINILRVEKLLTTASFVTYTGSINTKLSNIESTTSSLNSFTSSINTTIKSKLDSDGVISGSLQILSGSNLVSSSTQVTAYGFATTGSNIFVGNQTHSGSIIPSVDNTYDLGSVTHQWKDVYISSGSLYIDGTKVLGSTSQELTITTDTGQSIKILEAGSDSIILQSADGDIELKSSGGGDILFDPTNGLISIKGTTQIQDGFKITSSGGTNIVFGDTIIVSGSIDLTGNVDGIDLQSFSSSVSASISSLLGGNTSLSSSIATTTSGLSSSLSSSIGSLSSSIATTDSNQDGKLTSLESYTGSNNTVIGTLQTSTSSLNTFSSSANGRLTALETTTSSLNALSNSINASFELSGSNVTVKGNFNVQGSTTNVNTTTLNLDNNLINLNGNGAAFAGLRVNDTTVPNTISGSFLWDSTNDNWIGGQLGSEQRFVRETEFNNAVTRVGNVETSTGSLNSFTSSINTTIKNKLNTDTVMSGSYLGTATTANLSENASFLYYTDARVKTKLNAEGVVSGSSQVSFTGISDKPTLVSGSAQISFNGITDKPALVSGSSQISYPSLSNIPGGIVSGSAQIDLTATTNYSTGIKTRLNAEGVISGSSQVTGIGNSQLTNSSFHVVTTSISLGRASASQTLTGVSIDGSSASSPTLTSSGTLTTQAGSGTLTYTSPIVSSEAGLFSTGDNSNSIITFNRHPGAYYSQLGFNSTGGIFYRSFNNTSINTSQAWQTVWTSSSLTNLNQLSNGPGYITGISFANVSSKPTTLSGYGITDALPLAGGTMTGTITITNTDIRSNSTSNWTGDPGTQGKIQYHAARWYIVSDSGSDRIVQFRRNGTDVSYIDNSGNFIGNASTATSATSATTAGSTGTLSSNAVTSGYLVIAGNYSNNAYNAVSSTRLFFGGGDSDAVANYYIGTNLENVGGNYTKLDLRWHTGIRMGATPGYGGIRFFDTEDLGTVLFSISNGDSNVRSHTNLIPSANNSYNLGSSSLRWANLFTNDLHLSNEGKEGGNEIDGTTGDWTIQEGNENLYIINNKNGKKFKIDLTEIV